MVKEFETKDFIYNNGIINFVMLLKEDNFGISWKLERDKLTIDYQDENVIFNVLEYIIKKNNLLVNSSSEKVFFDTNRKEFILMKGFNVIGGHSNDIRNGVYLIKNKDEILKEYNLTEQELEEKYINFCKKQNIKIDKIKSINVAITMDEAIKRLAKYIMKTDKNEMIEITSKIHNFENGSNDFHNLLKTPKSYTLNKWDALIYWFGDRIDRFYKNIGDIYYTIYLNTSFDLLSLMTIKEFLQIQKLNNEIKYSNIKSIKDFEFFILSYLFSLIENIETQYLKANTRRKANREKLYNALQYIEFVANMDKGDSKAKQKQYFEQYNKVNKLFSIFKALKEKDLFEYFSNLVINFNNKEVGDTITIKKNLIKNILNFRTIRKELYLNSFNILKEKQNKVVPYYFHNNRDKKNKYTIFELQSVYLNSIKGDEMEVKLNEPAKLVGEKIGLFCANIDNKDLLFKLRNIKNSKQLLSYFKDLKFAMLKNENKINFNSNEFKEELEKILEHIDDNWEIIRDYVAIYAIDKYMVSNYAKKQNQGDKK